MPTSIQRLRDRLLFSDMGPVIRRGLERVIGPEDLPALPADLDPRSGSPDFTHVACTSAARFLGGIVRVMRREFVTLLSLGLLPLAFDLASPLLVRRLLGAIARAASPSSSWPSPPPWGSAWSTAARPFRASTCSTRCCGARSA